MAKKALLVGINAYPGSPLSGCLNDVEDMFHLLTQFGGFSPDAIHALCDQRATTQGIREGMAWLRNGVASGDEVVFHYSGHGSQVRCKRGDELDDGLDECLCPVNLDDADYWDKGVIIDDELGDWLASFPAGVRLTVVLDCCHSGNGTRDLGPGNPHPIKERYLHPPLDIALRHKAVEGHRKELQKRRIGKGVARTKKRGFFDWLFGSKKAKRQRPARALPAEFSVPQMNHLLFSGCRADQTSADAYINGRYNGALTRYFVDEVKKSPLLSASAIHAALLAGIKAGGYTQVPQLEGPQDRLNGPVFG